MTGPTITTKPFNSYVVTYAIANPNGQDYARIDCLSNGVKVGQILFGSAIKPGTYAAKQGDLIVLYFPSSHFLNIITLLQHEQHLAMYIQSDTTLGPAAIMLGGITTQR